MDMTTPETAGWWLKRLGAKLDARQSSYHALHNYYRGDHPLPEGDQRVREFYRAFQRKARTNYCGLIANATGERIRYDGINVGTVPDQAEGNRLARLVWQASNMDAGANLVHSTALSLADSYVIVGPAPEGKQFPLITAEDPRQVIIETDPLDRNTVRAGLKTWIDVASKTRHAVVFLPDSIHYFEAQGLTRSFASNAWEVERPAVVNPLGLVSIVRFVGRPIGFEGEGLAEFEDCLDIQDRINDTILNRMVITKMQAYRQRYMIGGSTVDENGEPAQFFPGADLVWAVEDENVKFGDFDQADLGPLLDAVKEDVAAIVVLSGLPPQYLAGGIVNVSADALAATDARQVDKCIDRMTYFGESWELVNRLAFGWMGKSELFGDDAEVQWQDPQRRSVAQLADAATKYQAAGVPWEARMRLLGFGDADIPVLRQQRDQDIADGLFAPEPATPVAPAA